MGVDVRGGVVRGITWRDIVVGGFIARGGAEHDAGITQRLDGGLFAGAEGWPAEGRVQGDDVDAALFESDRVVVCRKHRREGELVQRP